MSEAIPSTGQFPGGFRLPGRKEQSTARPIRTAPIPKQVILQLDQHVGTPAIPIVHVGDRVLRGQPIAEPSAFISAGLHASTSGTITDIGDYPVAHPSGMTAPCIVIEADRKDERFDGYAPISKFVDVDPAELRQHVRNLGIVGLGGARFPTNVKLNVPSGTVELLILNGAECEPYISCDQQLLRERAEEVVRGAQIMLHILQTVSCIVAVEEDKPEAINALRAAIDKIADDRIVVNQVPAVYPEGGERQLIQVLTGKEVPADGLPADIGCLTQNVGTASAVYRGIVHGEPLISRIVTITGGGVREPCNLEVRIGTLFGELIEFCGGYTEDVVRLIMGGPMMGFALRTDAVPVEKGTNSILAATAAEIVTEYDEMPCIRCGECARVCPASLLPQQLYWHARAEDHEQLQAHHLMDCIECGCCAYVCPSHIPLVQYYRHAKGQIWADHGERQRADLARHRYELRTQRLQTESDERALRLARKAARLNSDQTGKRDPIKEVMERVEKKKHASDGEEN